MTKRCHIAVLCLVVGFASLVAGFGSSIPGHAAGLATGSHRVSAQPAQVNLQRPQATAVPTTTSSSSADQKRCQPNDPRRACYICKRHPNLPLCRHTATTIGSQNSASVDAATAHNPNTGVPAPQLPSTTNGSTAPLAGGQGIVTGVAGSPASSSSAPIALPATGGGTGAPGGAGSGGFPVGFAGLLLAFSALLLGTRRARCLFARH